MKKLQGDESQPVIGFQIQMPKCLTDEVPEVQRRQVPGQGTELVTGRAGTPHRQPEKNLQTSSACAVAISWIEEAQNYNKPGG